MSNAQQHALRILADAPLDEFAVTIHRIRRDTLQRLCDAGLARWCPYSRPDPSWQITPAGRNALSPRGSSCLEIISEDDVRRAKKIAAANDAASGR